MTANSNSKIKINMDALKTSKEWVRHKVKAGNNIFRILPPFGDASNGYPYRKWQIIWGLQDAESGRTRPYASPLMSEKRCPVVEFTDLLKTRLGQMEGELKARGLDEKSVRKHPVYERLSKFTRDITPKTVYIYNATDKSGVVGLLELKSTAHKEMKAQMNQYIQDYNQDPTSLNSAPDDSGVWFNVKRSGEGFDTEYKVEKVQTKVKAATGGISFEDDRSPLPEVIVENFNNVAYDLGSIYKTTTYDEINELLQANLDRFYEICPEANTSVPYDLDQDGSAPAPAPKLAAAPKVAAVPQGKKPVALLKDDDDEPATKTVKASSAPVTTATAAADEDDFMAQADAILKG